MKKRLVTSLLTIFLLFLMSSTWFRVDASLFSSNKYCKEKPFTMVWLSDPQYYAESYPQIYDFLGDWFVKKYKGNSFGYLIVSGDIINNASCVKQWKVASRNFKKLDDADVPYGILAGNHDVIMNGLNYNTFKSYFGSSRYINKSWYGGNMDNNRNHYDLTSFGRHNFIVLYLGFGTETTLTTTNWANKVLEKYGHRNAILVLHEYLDSDGEMTEKARIVSDSIVLKNDNVFLVLCGHFHGAQRKVKMICNSDGTTRKVVEILSDYQKAPYGGNGFLRFLKFSPQSGTLKVSLYSPYAKMDSYFGEGLDDFTENIKLID
ncbi:metallophosphoesterase [Ruminiclostridium cellulolyticum]|uniref:Metallophosphoesterase n=1 Tax=Ruminiclostridium cellulolyticum (strain ATCC 35319 / DSM 5812 / JCM 6584 / H10) TaxID=394503 RepID=B8I7W5_RUMCH|nr:metallophosphoesterase [Ruminiclostridium cellulolyticum]ACL75122.1 metallophosphoesterase [Ruminiclostridium cellulolyticum H10]